MISPAVETIPEAVATAGNPPAPVLIIGVGNLLMGDEGVGIHVLRALERSASIPGVALLDGGTGGIILLEILERSREVIMVDATRDGRVGGTVTLLEPARVADLPRGLSAHDFGLKDLFAAAALLGCFPRIHLFTISVETIRPMCLELSPSIAAAVPRVADSARALARQLAGRATDRRCLPTSLSSR